MHLPTLLNFPPSHLIRHPTPLGNHGAPSVYSGSSLAIYFAHGGVYLSMLLSTHPTLPFPAGVHKSILMSPCGPLTTLTT